MTYVRSDLNAISLEAFYNINGGCPSGYCEGYCKNSNCGKYCPKSYS